jgi:hypothetical protein
MSHSGTTSMCERAQLPVASPVKFGADACNLTT